MSLLLVLAACLLTCLGQIAQKYAVESWRVTPSGWGKKLRSPWLWLAVVRCSIAPRMISRAQIAA